MCCWTVGARAPVSLVTAEQYTTYAIFDSRSDNMMVTGAIDSASAACPWVTTVSGVGAAPDAACSRARHTTSPGTDSAACTATAARLVVTDMIETATGTSTPGRTTGSRINVVDTPSGRFGSWSAAPGDVGWSSARCWCSELATHTAPYAAPRSSCCVARSGGKLAMRDMVTFAVRPAATAPWKGALGTVGAAPNTVGQSEPPPSSSVDAAQPAATADVTSGAGVATISGFSVVAVVPAAAFSVAAHGVVAPVTVWDCGPTTKEILFPPPKSRTGGSAWAASASEASK
mmetsp:Transcript_104113/g.238420  ORF Transcript_104113/g.238420 Transcript_104113/m.238420 type:complete len:288 (-) Transcript_104113:2837-3700(-)